MRGMVGMAALLGVYFAVVGIISGSAYALEQFSAFWYFIVSLALGFGIQVGLYSYLRDALQQGEGSGKVVAVSGTASTAAMISCCAHYLVNIIPILGLTGFATVMSQYQVKFFWLGMIFNFLGIMFIFSRIIKFSRHEAI